MNSPPAPDTNPFVEPTAPPPPPAAAAPPPPPVAAPPPAPAPPAAAPPPPPTPEPVAPATFDAPPTPVADVPPPPPAPDPAAAPAPEPVAATAPMPDAVSGPGLTDPFGLGAAMDRLASGSRKTGRAAALVAAARMELGESVLAAVVGRFQGADAVLVITDRRMVVANDRAWEPDVVPVGLELGLTVQGWADGRNAVLRFERDGVELVVDRIADAEIARDIAGMVRERAGG